MFFEENELKAVNGNVVVKLHYWPASSQIDVDVAAAVDNIDLRAGGANGAIYGMAKTAVRQWDNGREAYVGTVLDTDNEYFSVGDEVVMDIYHGAHVPLKDTQSRVKIVPATGIVLKSKAKLKMTKEIVNMEPGINRLYIKVLPKDSVSASGIIMHDPNLSAQAPTAQDVREAVVLKSNDKNFTAGEAIVIEADAGKTVYLDSDTNKYILCYATDVLAKLKA